MRISVAGLSYKLIKRTLAMKYFWLTFLLLNSSICLAQSATVAVASNMKDAFSEIQAVFTVSTKTDLKVIYGSSGNFTRQIMNGAPFDLFISADEQFPLALVKNGKTIDSGAVYAIGKIVLLTKKSSGIALKSNQGDLASVLSKANKIVMAKPEIAPYGHAAIEYMQAMNLWNIAKSKLVYGDNISVATMFVTSGAADIGFSALSLAKSPAIEKETDYLLLDESLYQPILQRMVLMKGAPSVAVNLYQFMQSAQAKAILLKYGYSVPQ